MRIFALETDIRSIKNRFIVEGQGDEELLTARHHGLYFFVHFLKGGFVVLLLAVLLDFFWEEGYLDPFTVTVLLLVWGFISFLVVVNALIRWKLNVLIITTGKIVSVTQISFFYQEITPINLEAVSSIKMESQFWGLVNVGKVHINLHERLQSSTRELIFYYMARPTDITGAIENAVTLAKHKEEKIEEPAIQQSEQEIQQKVAEAA